MSADLLRRKLRGPAELASADDIQAIDRGESRTVACTFRASYGSFPKRFGSRMADLTPERLVIRPYWYSLRRRTYRIADPILSAGVRPRNAKSDWNIRATGMYASSGSLSWAGFEVVRCQTARGIIEIAVPRPDVPLLLHYLRHVKPGKE